MLLVTNNLWNYLAEEFWRSNEYFLLDVIHMSSFECDIFAREAVLAVGIGPYFYGFLIEKQ